MKIGDIVRFRSQPDPAIGIVVTVGNKSWGDSHQGEHTVGILWDFINDIGWQRPGDIEIIYEV